MKMGRKLIKFILGVLIVAILGLFLGYFYIKSSWDSVLSEDELTELVTKIKYSEELPERFFELYEETYPEVLSKSLNQQILDGLTGDFVKSPSLLASSISEHTRMEEDSTHISNKRAYALAWKLEEETTQKECLNWALYNYKFALYIHGIDEVAQHYYRKGVTELNERELKDIIELMKTPSLISVPERPKNRYPIE